MARAEDPTLADIDDVAGMCVGIRSSVAVLAARWAGRMSRSDEAELDTIIYLTRRIQALCAPYRAQISAAYQTGFEDARTIPTTQSAFGSDRGGAARGRD